MRQSIVAFFYHTQSEFLCNGCPSHKYFCDGHLSHKKIVFSFTNMLKFKADGHPSHKLWCKGHRLYKNKDKILLKKNLNAQKFVQPAPIVHKFLCDGQAVAQKSLRRAPIAQKFRTCVVSFCATGTLSHKHLCDKNSEHVL